MGTGTTQRWGRTLDVEGVEEVVETTVITSTDRTTGTVPSPDRVSVTVPPTTTVGVS